MASRDHIKQAALEQVNEGEVLEFFQKAVQTPSITGDEAAFADMVRRQLQDIGLDPVESFDFRPGRPDVWGLMRGLGGGKDLMFAGHLDTVPVEGWASRWKGTSKESPFGGVLEGGEVWGRGAGDMKAGVTGILFALKAIKRANIRLKGNVVTVFVGDEETGIPGTGYSDGMKAIIERVRAGEIPSASFAIYTEPTTLDVYPAQIGFIIADITVQGKSAYYGTPWLGVDALKGAHRLLGRLFEYSGEIWKKEDHPLLGRPFNLVTAIQGGGYIAVPEQCKVSLIRKILPSENVDDVQKELENILRVAAIEDGIQSSIEYTASRDHRFGGRPAEVSADLEGVTSLEGAVREITGKSEVIKGSPYWSETSMLLYDLGIPAVYCGAGDITNCHTVTEHVKIPELIDSVRAFALMMIDYCGTQ